MASELLNITKIWKLIKGTDNPKDRNRMHADGNGLYLRLRNNGTERLWFYRYFDPVEGKRRKITLGTFPGLPLEQARKKAADYTNIMRDAGNPHLERDKARDKQMRKRDKTKTVNEVINLYLKNIVDSVSPGYYKNLNHWHLPMVRKSIGNVLIGQVTPLTILEKVGDICVNKGRSKPEYKTIGLRAMWKERQSSKEFQRVVESLFEYAVNVGIIKSNPATMQRLQLPEHAFQTEHRKEVPQEYVGLVFHALRSYRYQHSRHKFLLAGKRPPIAMLIEWVGLTGVRHGEARLAQYKEIDWERKVWIVPAMHRKMKMKYKKNPSNTHELPITPAMFNILKDLKANGYNTSPDARIFPALSNDEIFDASTVADFLRKHFRPYLKRIYGVDLVFHAHGLRSSLQDWWRAKGYPAALWKLQVGQRPGGDDELRFDNRKITKTDNAYGHNQLTEDRRGYMKEWDNLCSRFSPTSASKKTAGKTVTNISDYRKKRRVA
jgi:integrase